MVSALFPVVLLLATALLSGSAEAGECTNQQKNACLSGANCQTNQAGAAQCSCPSGFTGNGLTTPCVDINECSATTNPCPTGSKCVNMAGSYFCSCPTGSSTTLDANGKTCQQVNSTITGTVISSRNKAVVYANVPVSLFTVVKETRSTIIGQGYTDAQGVYRFDVAFGSRYITCAVVNGYEACVVHTVPALTTFLSTVEYSDIDMDASGTLVLDSNTARRRRLANLNSLNIPVPSSLATFEWEIHTIWAMDNNLYQCDWDSTVLSTINSGCFAAMKSNNAGSCSSTGRDVYIMQDSSCQQDSYGFESVLISETGTRTYQHMVYGYGVNSSFSSAAGSQGQINVYRSGGSNKVVLACSTTLSSAIRGNFNDRFWHTFSLAINTPASNVQGTGTITEKNIVSCTPQETTGSNATLGFENGDRRCS